MPFSEEHRKKISEDHKGLVLGMYGKRHSEESKQKMSQSLKKCWQNPEFRKKLSLAKLGKKGNMSNRWKDGKYYHSGGYILVYKPVHPLHNNDGYVFEQRLVMEKKLGRYLRPEEVVHHINGKKDDNHSENLMLFANNTKHLEYHRTKEN